MFTGARSLHVVIDYLTDLSPVEENREHDVKLAKEPVNIHRLKLARSSGLRVTAVEVEYSPYFTSL